MLKREQTTVIQFDQPINDLNLVWDNEQLNVAGRDLVADDNPEKAVPIYAPNVSKIVLNGETVPFTRQGDYVYAVRLAEAHHSNITDSLAIDIDPDERTTVAFELVPAKNEIDGWIGLNTDANCENECYAMAIQLHPDGTFLASDGTEKTALVHEPYFANQLVKVSLDIDPGAGTYDVYVTREGGFETLIAKNHSLHHEISGTNQLFVQLQSKVEQDFSIQNLKSYRPDGEKPEDFAITVLNEPHHSNGMDDMAPAGDYTFSEN